MNRHFFFWYCGGAIFAVFRHLGLRRHYLRRHAGDESVDYLLGRFLARNPGSERTLLLLVLSTTPVQPLTFFNDPRRFTFVVCFSAKKATRCLEDSFELKYRYTGVCSLLGCMHARLIVKHWLIVKHSGIPQPVS